MRHAMLSSYINAAERKEEGKEATKNISRLIKGLA